MNRRTLVDAQLRAASPTDSRPRGIAIEDKSRKHPCAGRDELISRGKDGHAGTAYDRDGISSQGSQHSRLARREDFAASQHGFPSADVRAREGDIHAGRGGAPHQERGVQGIGVFDHDNSIGSTRQHRPRRW